MVRLISSLFSKLNKERPLQTSEPGGGYFTVKLGLVRKLFGHAIQEKTILEEMDNAGYPHLKSHAILTSQSFNIFEVK